MLALSSSAGVSRSTLPSPFPSQQSRLYCILVDRPSCGSVCGSFKSIFCPIATETIGDLKSCRKLLIFSEVVQIHGKPIHVGLLLSFQLLCIQKLSFSLYNVGRQSCSNIFILQWRQFRAFRKRRSQNRTIPPNPKVRESTVGRFLDDNDVVTHSIQS